MPTSRYVLAAITFVGFFTYAPTAIAESVVQLACTGINSQGKSKTFYVAFSPDNGWMSVDNGMRMTGTVTPTQLRIFQLTVDRRTGEFVSTDSLPFKGSCKKPDTKF